MNILYINHEKNLGGASKCLISIMQASKNSDNKVICLTPFGEGEFFETCKALNIPVIRRRFVMCISKKQQPSLFERIILLLLAYVYNFVLAISVINVIKREHIDIIHSNSSVINIGCFISKMTGIRHIMHIREYVYEDFNWAFIPNREKVMKLYDNHCTEVIFISKTLMKRYSGYFKKSRVIQIYDGVDVDNCLDSKHDINKIGFVGRIIEGKGQAQAIRALDILVNQYEKKDLKLYIVGSGDKNYIDELKEMVKDLGLESHVIFVGYKSDVNIYRQKFGMELFCSASEGFGRVVIEAMLVGNIVITSDRGAFPEIVDDKVTGFIYPYGNYEMLASIVNSLLNEGNIREIRTRARKEAKLVYSESINTKSILALYDYEL